MSTPYQLQHSAVYGVVLCGGWWYGNEDFLRPTYHISSNTDYDYDYFDMGFRVALSFRVALRRIE